MSTEGAGPRRDGDPGGQDAATDKVVPEGRGDVRGISDLTYRIITPYLRHARPQKVVFIVLVVLTAVCVIAAAVRLSPLPLLSLPLFGVGYYALRRARTAQEDSRLLFWSSLCLAATLIGFWVMSVVGNWLH
jgi:hypothetical protein